MTQEKVPGALPETQVIFPDTAAGARLLQNDGVDPEVVVGEDSVDPLLRGICVRVAVKVRACQAPLPHEVPTQIEQGVADRIITQGHRRHDEVSRRAWLLREVEVPRLVTED